MERRTKHRRGDGMSHGKRCGGGRVKTDGCRRAGVSEQMAAMGDDDTPDSGDRGCIGTNLKVHKPRGICSMCYVPQALGRTGPAIARERCCLQWFERTAGARQRCGFDDAVCVMDVVATMQA